jgi:hypothetical protein
MPERIRFFFLKSSVVEGRRDGEREREGSLE